MMTESAISEGSGCRPCTNAAMRTEAGVGKPEEKEPAGGMPRRCRAFYGDCGLALALMAAAGATR